MLASYLRLRYDGRCWFVFCVTVPDHALTLKSGANATPSLQESFSLPVQSDNPRTPSSSNDGSTDTNSVSAETTHSIDTTSTANPVTSGTEAAASNAADDNHSTDAEIFSHLGPRRRKLRLPCLNSTCTRQFSSEYTRKVFHFFISEQLHFVKMVLYGKLMPLVKLQVHMGSHIVKPRKKHPCRLGCLAQFSRNHDRLRHEVAQHGKSCQWSCPGCTRPFSSAKALNAHICNGSSKGR